MNQPGVIGHFALDQSHRIHYRRQVHQQLHAKTNEVSQIPVLGHQRGNQHAQSQSQNSYQDNEEGKKQNENIQVDVSSLQVEKNIK